MKKRKHSAQTIITGEVKKPARCHQYGGGVVANFIVDVDFMGHCETYQCVAFKDLGAEIESSIQQGQIVTCTGHMKTSPWRDDPDRENHQLIVNEFEIVAAFVAVNDKPKPKPPTPKRARKTKDLDQPFNDSLPF